MNGSRFAQVARPVTKSLPSLFFLASFGAIFAAPALADDQSDVRAANDAFEQAFSRRDLAGIEAAWAHDGSVTTLHPISKAVVVGWSDVRQSWEATLQRWSEVSATMDGAQIGTANSVGWVVGIERVRGRRPNGEQAEVVALTTNIFEKRGDRWVMVHHHGSRLPQ